MTTVPLQVDPATLETAINNSWILLVSFLIFFMHAGFAMLEAGQVRSKNVANQLTKNLLTWSVGVTVFFLIGAGVDSLVGTGSFAFVPGGEASGWIGWLYGAVFAMTAATIVSGAVAGRAKLRAYVTYTFLLAAVIYPVVSGMAWYGTGLLGIDGAIGSAIGAPFDDFAGGTVVHAVGGVAGLTAAWILGPRIGRYNDDGSANVIPGHSMTFAVLGTLMLAFGWYGFNVGTSAILGGGSFLGAQLGRVAMTTTVAMACGAMGAGLASWLRTGKVDTLYVANGLLAGLVGITAIPHATSWWGAFVVGAIAGIQLPIVFEFVEKRLKIDDVCAVFPVHGSAGIIGTLLLPVVVAPSYLGGLGYGRVDMFLAQLAGVVVIMAWTVLSTGLVWGVFKALGQARVSPGHEREGLDISEHGVETYPEFEETGELGEGAAVSDGGEPCDARRSSSDRRSDGGVPVEDAEDGRLMTDGGVPMTDGGATEEGDIKLVMAYVRPDKLADVKQGLAEIGAPSLSVTQVSGRGSQPSKTGQWRGEEYVVDLHQKVKIECVVADVPAEDVVDAIEESARTGEPGDGKIFVLPVESAVQIRTGKTGTEAV